MSSHAPHIQFHLRRPIVVLGVLLVCTLLIGESRVQAATSISTVGSHSVRELAHEREIVLSESVAKVTETITFANAGATAAELVYGFDLPPQAAVYDLIIATPGGTTSRYGVVDAAAAARLVASPGGESPDLGLLRMVSVQPDGPRARRRYELRVFPVPGNLSTKVSLRWQSPVQLVSGRHQLRIPRRGQAPLLARSEVHLRTAMATGSIYAGGAELAQRSSKGKRHSFFELSERDLVIQVEPKSTRSKPYAEVSLFPLGPISGVAAVRIVLPAKSSNIVSKFSRVLLIVDVSRSMAEDGREAASLFVDALLADLGTSTQVEAILYDRKATRIFGSMQPGTKERRRKIVQAIRSAPGNNGSDLRGALQLARTALQHRATTTHKGDTLIAVVSDGILSEKLSGHDATSQLGPEIMAQARLLSAVLVPPNAPLPALTDHPMSHLAHNGRGRVATLHYGDAAKMGAALLRGLAQPVPLTDIGLHLDRGSWFGAEPRETVAPGSSAIALGYYQGDPPKRITVEAKQGRSALRLTARNIPGRETRGWARMTLADSSADQFPTAELPAANRRAFVKSASALGVVTQVSAAVVTDKRDAFANDRMDLAARQGGQHYRRLAPSHEKNSKSHRYRRFEVLARDDRNPLDRDETGTVDRKMIIRRMRSNAIPVARGCYDKLLRRNQKAGGTVRIRFEFSRGEVHHVELQRIPLALRPIRDCIVDAVYAMPIPRVRQGSDPEKLNVVNYPLRFHPQGAGKGKIEEGTQKDDRRYIDTRDPLSGLPE